MLRIQLFLRHSPSLRITQNWFILFYFVSSFWVISELTGTTTVVNEQEKEWVSYLLIFVCHHNWNAASTEAVAVWVRERGREKRQKQKWGHTYLLEVTKKTWEFFFHFFLSFAWMYRHYFEILMKWNGKKARSRSAK